MTSIQKNNLNKQVTIIRKFDIKLGINCSYLHKILILIIRQKN